jgi:chaperonin GroEL
MNKEILFGAEARTKILEGLNIAAKAVGSTLGPKGQNVIFEESSFPTITKDGVTVAQQVFLEDKFQNMGVMLAREAAQNTNQEAGDGTTTTVVLLASIVNEANKYIIAGMNPILIKRGMDKALEIVLESLKKQVKQIKTDTEKLQIATISANNDKEIGETIHTVIKKVGTDGIITIQTSNNLKTEVEYVKGTKLNSGLQSGIFVNNAKKLACEMQNPAIIITTDNVTNQSQLIPIVEKLITAGKRNMILFANSIEGSALAFLIQNHMLGKFT